VSLGDKEDISCASDTASDELGVLLMRGGIGAIFNLV
jgi:hypothetical protein